MQSGDTIEVRAPGQEPKRVAVRGTLDRNGLISYLLENLDDQSTYLVDAREVTEIEDALYMLRTPLSAHPAVRDGGTATIAVIEERVGVSTREVPTGRLVLDRTVHTEIEPIRADLSATRYEVERIKVGRWAETEAETAPHRDGEAMVYPVVREELVVTRRLFIEEQVRVTERTERTRYKDEIALRRAEVRVHRESIEDAEPGSPGD